MTRRAAGPASILALALAATPALAADVEVRAVALTRYETTEVKLGPGDRLVFANADPFAEHNLTSVTEDSKGTPLFATPTLVSGTSAAVSGIADLPAGDFAFFCTIHPTSMRGRLQTTGVPDTRAPVVSAVVLPRSRARVRQTKRLLVSVLSDEAGSATVRARAKGQTIAKSAVILKAGSTQAVLELTQAGRRLLRRHARLAVTVTIRAADQAGNPATATATRTLK